MMWIGGCPHGLYQEWYENGKPKYTYNIDSGSKRGEYKEWAETGELIRHCDCITINGDTEYIPRAKN